MSLARPEAFFASLKAGLLGPILTASEVAGLSAILSAMEGLPLAWTAYALATAYHETAHSMQPVKERGGEAYYTRMYDPLGQRPQVAAALGNTEPGDGSRFAGRGYVQLTGRDGYARAGELLGQDLIANPDLALRPVLAASIMRLGMKGGWFTGKSFGSFLPSKGPAKEAQFIQARRIINGLDRAELIAGYALQFQEALIAGGWAA